MTSTIERTTQPKIDHLRDLIARELVPAGEITVIARSGDSPVVRALNAARDALAGADCSLRVIFLQASSRLDDAMPDALSIDVRHALNPRLLDAHEQLVVGNAVWIGDCMRRDPGKRDAFTQEKFGCSVTSRFAALSFEKLWAIAMPVIPAVTAPDLSATSAAPRDIIR